MYVVAFAVISLTAAAVISAIICLSITEGLAGYDRKKQ